MFCFEIYTDETKNEFYQPQLQNATVPATQCMAFLTVLLAILCSYAVAMPFLEPNPTESTYIVAFRNDTSELNQLMHMQSVRQQRDKILARRGLRTRADPISRNFQIHHWRAYAAPMDEVTLSFVRNDGCVHFAEIESTYTASDIVAQIGAPYGLAVLSHSSALSLSTAATYLFENSSQGNGGTAYVIDTGIDITHPDFEGRAQFGANFVHSFTGDDNSHGTHVAGIIGSASYGVAKQVSLVSIKVLDASGSGSNSAILAGIEHVSQQCGKGKSIANLSLGGSFSQSLNAAVDSLVAAGCFVTVAAGNGGVDACQTSPSSAESVLTVGGTDQTNSRFVLPDGASNFGSCVGLIAPGVDILSTVPGGGAAVKSGTSMSSPFVAGIAASLWTGHDTSVATLRQQIALYAIKDVVSDVVDSPNLLAFNGIVI